MCFVPGNDPKKIIGAEIYRPDCIIYDLEDSVSIFEKDSARILVKYALQYNRPDCRVGIRINQADSPYYEDDVSSMVPLQPDFLRLPKAETAEAVSYTHLTPQGFARDAEFFKNVKGFDVVTGHEAQKIDRANKTVTVMDKETGAIQEMSYDVLVLGTGATPVKLSLPGAELGGIHNFWFPWETLKVKEEMEAYKVTDVVIVGAGLIGMELAEAFHKQGLTVNIVEMQDRILPQMLDLEMADLVKKPLEKAGIRLRCV